MVEILDQTQEAYIIPPAQTVQRLLGYVPEGDLGGLDRILLLDHEAEANSAGRLGLYRLVGAERPTGRRARHKPARAEREIVLLFGPLLGQERRKLQATMLVASTLFQQIGQHVLALRPLAGASKQGTDERLMAARYADLLLLPLIREQTVRGLRSLSLLLLVSLALGVASFFTEDATSKTAVLLALVIMVAPLLLLNAGGAYRPSTRRLTRPLLLIWVALVWGAAGLIALFSASAVQAALAFGLGLVSLALGLSIGLAGGWAARFWWARPIGPVRPPLSVALFGATLLTGVAPWLHLAMTANAAIITAAPLWALVGAASLALASTLGWWLLRDLQQDALEASGELTASKQDATGSTGSQATG